QGGARRGGGRAARPRRLRPRDRLEPRRHAADLRLRRRHRPRLGFSLGAGANEANACECSQVITCSAFGGHPKVFNPLVMQSPAPTVKRVLGTVFPLAFSPDGKRLLAGAATAPPSGPPRPGGSEGRGPARCGPAAEGVERQERKPARDRTHAAARAWLSAS